mgnify:CR=1 FL=1
MKKLLEYLMYISIVVNLILLMALLVLVIARIDKNIINTLLNILGLCIITSGLSFYFTVISANKQFNKLLDNPEYKIIHEDEEQHYYLLYNVNSNKVYTVETNFFESKLKDTGMVYDKEFQSKFNKKA